MASRRLHARCCAAPLRRPLPLSTPNNELFLRCLSPKEFQVLKLPKNWAYLWVRCIHDYILLAAVRTRVALALGAPSGSLGLEGSESLAPGQAGSLGTTTSSTATTAGATTWFTLGLLGVGALALALPSHQSEAHSRRDRFSPTEKSTPTIPQQYANAVKEEDISSPPPRKELPKSVPSINRHLLGKAPKIQAIEPKRSPSAANKRSLTEEVAFLRRVKGLLLSNAHESVQLISQYERLFPEGQLRKEAHLLKKRAKSASIEQSLE